MNQSFRRLMSAALAAVLMLCCMLPAAAAPAAGVLTVQLPAEPVEAGTQVSVPIRYTGHPGVNSFRILIGFDRSRVSLPRENVVCHLPGGILSVNPNYRAVQSDSPRATPGTVYVSVVFAAASPVPADKTDPMLTLKLQIAQDAAPGDCGLQIIPMEMERTPADGSGQSQDLSSVRVNCGSLQIAGEKISVFGANMTLGNELAMNFFVKKSQVKNPAGLSMQITKQFADNREDVVVNIPFARWTSYNSNYMVSFDDISAKEMTDQITVRVLRNGQPAGIPYTDSVEDYALRILRKSSTKPLLKSVIVDMLNFGAAAQQKFRYHEDLPANTHLTAQEQQLGSPAAPAENIRKAGPNYYGSNLNLGNSMALTVYFQNITPDMKAQVHYIKHTGQSMTLTVPGSQLIRFNDHIYGVRVTSLVVADAAQPVEVTVFDSSGRTVAGATDSIGSYVARSTGLGALGDAIMKFSASAKAYFSARG